MPNKIRTLQAIADHGADVFYTGPFGKLPKSIIRQKLILHSGEHGQDHPRLKRHNDPR